MPRLLTHALLNPVPSVRSLLHLHRDADIAGRTVVLTGASSGIGEAVALRLAAAGARLLLVARDPERLAATTAEIERHGDEATWFSCDLTDGDQIAALVEEMDRLWGAPPDILINNAGRSIRRSAFDAVDRVHDYERTMALNYFGPVRLTLALLPAMRARGGGHIINISTWGTTAGVMPKFSAYHASKSAIAAFGRSLGAEARSSGITVSTLGFPLVRTPMIAPTADYDSAPALSPAQAAAWVLRAIETKPVELYPLYAGVLRAISTVSPRLADELVIAAGI